MGIHSEERLIRDGDGAFLASLGSAKMLSEGREVELVTDDWEGSKEADVYGVPAMFRRPRGVGLKIPI